MASLKLSYWRLATSGLHSVDSGRCLLDGGICRISGEIRVCPQAVLLDLEYTTQREKLYQSTVDFERVESLLDVRTRDTLNSETRMTASVLKRDAHTEKVQILQILCLYHNK